MGITGWGDGCRVFGLQLTVGLFRSLVSQNPSLINSACEFPVDVITYDLPAEIFLQRPLLVNDEIQPGNIQLSDAATQACLRPAGESDLLLH